MPRLDGTDRAILTGAGILVIVLVLLTALLNSGQNAGRAGYPSSYSTQWDGAKAAYELLHELGYKVQRWDDSPLELGGDVTKQVFILAGPTVSPNTEEVGALRTFLERGGTVIAAGDRAAAFLPAAEPFMEDFAEDSETKFPAEMPSPLTRGTPNITMMPPVGWLPQSAAQVTVYGNKETAAVTTYMVGKGRVIWWGSASPLTNRGIKSEGNVMLLLNSVGAKGARDILWDEYFHGARGDLLSFVGRTPIPWVFAQLALVVVFVMMSYSRRYGAIRMPGKESRLSPLEFVDTLGDLYTAAHAGSAAVRVAYQGFRVQLLRQLGLASNTPAAQIARAANRTLGWDEEPFMGSLARAERASRSLDLKDDEALEIVQDIDDYAARLRTRRTKAEERKPG